MNSFGIRDWNNGEAFAIYSSNSDVLNGGNENRRYYAFQPAGEDCIDVGYQTKEKRYSTFGKWSVLNCGDIIYIKADGTASILYTKGQPEVDLFITNKCNSNCVMCPLSETVRRQNNSGQLEWILDFINLLPAYLPYINITGGEPTLEKDRFVVVMSRLREKFQHTEFQLLTNGRSLADKAFLDRLISFMPYNIRIAIPLHSSNEWLHDSITQSKGSFKQTDYAIRNLLDAQQKVELRIVLSKLNLPSVADTVRYITKEYAGVFVVNFIGMEMMGNAARNRAALWEDYAIVFRQIRDSVRYLIEHGIDTQLYNFPLCAVDQGYWPLVPKSITGYKIRYKEECENCSVKGICGGFFYSTLKLMDPTVRVIKRDETELLYVPKMG